MPMLPAIGSTMTAATCAVLASNSAATLTRSLKGAVSVSAAVEAATPGLVGTPSVSAPEPASTRKPSAWPW